MPEHYDGRWTGDEESFIPESTPNDTQRDIQRDIQQDTQWDMQHESRVYTDLEPGWRAVRSLMHLRNATLLTIMLRPSFRPVRDLDLVPVAPCPYCLDGGMRSAGSVRVRKGRVPVRACDTCGAVDVGYELIATGYSV